MANFYKLDGKQDEQDHDNKSKLHDKYYDDEGKFKWDAESSSNQDDNDADEDSEAEIHEIDEDDLEESDESNVWDQLDKEEE